MRIGEALTRLATGIATSVLCGLGVAYVLTCEPAPAVKVRWRSDLDPSQRARLEAQFGLINPAAQEPAIFQYDLLDTSYENVRALVTTPHVLDTSDIDRVRYTLPLDVRYGGSWMWVANRTPVLRERGVVAGTVAVCAAGLLIAVARLTGVVGSARGRP